MAHSTYIPEVELEANQARIASRSPLLVRLTDFTFSLSFFA
jgi:hypothetical protein